MGDGMQRSCRGHKAICLNFDDEAHYEKCIRDKETFRQHIDTQYGEHPELFETIAKVGQPPVSHLSTHAHEARG